MRPEKDTLIPLDDLIVIVARWAKEQPEIARVLLFGSRVRGRTKDGEALRPGYGPGCSDLDVAVELIDDPSRQALERRVNVLHRWRPALQATLPVRAQLEVLDHENEYVSAAVAECSQQIYRRNR